jgi:hypothetical protein
MNQQQPFGRQSGEVDFDAVAAPLGARSVPPALKAACWYCDRSRLARTRLASVASPPSILRTIKSAGRN